SLGTFDDLVAGQNATGTLAGKPIDSPTNTVSTVLTGVTVSLLAATPPGTPTTITVDPAHVDNQSIKDKLKAFVTAYNDVSQSVRDKVTEKRVQNPKTDDDRIKGALFGDSTLTAIVNGLRSSMQNAVGGLAGGQNTMSAIGLSTGAIGSAYTTDLTSGKLTL